LRGGVILKVRQYWKSLQTETKHKIIIPIIFLCLIVLYITVQTVSTAMLMLFGIQTTGYGSGYFSPGHAGGGSITTSKSIGTYQFIVENGKQYTVRFSVEGRKHWPQSVVIYYQKGFPYNNTYGKPEMENAIKNCALPAVAGIGLVIYIISHTHKKALK